MIQRFLITLPLLLAAAHAPLFACGPAFPPSYLAEDAPYHPEREFRASLALLGKHFFAEDTQRELRSDAGMAQFDAVVADFQEAAPNRPTELAAYLDFDRRARNGTPPPLPENLPGELLEFYLYSLGWSELAQTPPDRMPPSWERLLRQPEGLRKYHTVRIHYVMGNRLVAVAPDKALAQYRLCRQACAAGFSDRQNLERASFAANARYPLVTLERLRYLALAEAAGVPADAGEFATLLRRAVYSGETPQMLADPLLREILFLGAAELPGLPPLCELLALRAPDSAPLLLAEHLAYRCYFSGELDNCRKLLTDIPEKSPMRLYLEARLLRRDGDFVAAADKLAAFLKICGDQLPGLKLIAASGAFESDMRQEVQGVLGRISISRNDFQEALLCFLKADSRYDMAAVAEQLLTLDELTQFCTRHAMGNSEAEKTLRHLLARRLFRSYRPREALSWMPEPWQKPLRTYLQLSEDANDPALPADERGVKLFNLGVLMMRDGFELRSTELEPDYHMLDGNYAEHPAAVWRTHSEEFNWLPVPARAPYRFQHRLEAAQLFARAGTAFRRSELRALSFLAAGTVLKKRHPELANGYYRLLCDQRPAPLAEEAAKLRWFPESKRLNALLFSSGDPAILTENQIAEMMEGDPK